MTASARDLLDRLDVAARDVAYALAANQRHAASDERLDLAAAPLVARAYQVFAECREALEAYEPKAEYAGTGGEQ